MEFGVVGLAVKCNSLPAMKNSNDIAQLSPAALADYAQSCFDVLCPDQQINRDYMCDVVSARARAIGAFEICGLVLSFLA